MTRVKSHYRVAWWNEGGEVVSLGFIFTDRKDALEFRDSIIRSHEEGDSAYDYYKVFEFLMEEQE